MQTQKARNLFGLGRSPVAPTFRDMPHYVPQKDYAG
jgi:hypothetical protein